MRLRSSVATGRRLGWQALVPIVLMGLASAWLGLLLKTGLTFRTVYVAAGVRRPLLLEIAGCQPWVALAAVLACEVAVAFVAWRSRRPRLWLTVEAVVIVALVTVFTPMLAASAYRPLQEVTQAIKEQRLQRKATQ